MENNDALCEDLRAWSHRVKHAGDARVGKDIRLYFAIDMVRREVAYEARLPTATVLESVHARQTKD
jgi:hypothetical protein